MIKVKRRTFLQGCCSGIAAMAGARLGSVSFAQTPGNRDILISVFLRGGMDALSFLSPFSDSNYHAARPGLGLESAHVHDLNGQFGLHLQATRLKELYDAKALALIPACGFPDGNRSHFEAQDMIDRGRTGLDGRSGDGWLARHLNPYTGSDSIFKAVSFNSSIAPSLEGYPGALTLDEPGDFTLYSHWNHEDDMRVALREMYAHDPGLASMAARTWDAVDTIDANPPGNYTPANGATYPNNDFGESLQSVAQLIRMDLGLEAATIDLGGWDTHESQANWNSPHQGYFANLVTTLSNGIGAFWQDMASHHGRLTVVVMSEFGRRLAENASTGTDHGHGGLMMVVSNNIREKKVYGNWPGLSHDQLFEGYDVNVTTDYRSVFAEILRARRGATPQQISNLFPNFTFSSPVGFFLDEASFASANSWGLYE